MEVSTTENPTCGQHLLQNICFIFLKINKLLKNHKHKNDINPTDLCHKSLKVTNSHNRIKEHQWNFIFQKNEGKKDARKWRTRLKYW